MIPLYQLTTEEVFGALKTDIKGLSPKEVRSRLMKYGKNTIEIEDKGRYWRMLFESLNDVLTWLLTAAAIVSFIMGDILTGSIFAVIIVLNVFLNFFQSYKAENIMESLKGYIHEIAKVRRGNEIIEIAVEEVVPGDIVILEEGDAVPADLRVIKENGLQVNSFAITGESNPQNKSAAPIHRDVSLADQTNMIFMGANIATGNCEAVIVSTGTDTVFGNIAKMSSEIQRDKTPLQQELDRMAKKNVFIALGILTLVLLLTLFVLDYGWEMALIFSIVVATSMVPQGLPMEINISLLLGVNRLGKKNVLIKKLSAVEALGSTSVICTDKTGTLTKNEMNVEHVFGKNFSLHVSGRGYRPTGRVTEKGKPLTARRRKEFETLFQSLHFNNRAHVHQKGKQYSVIGDPTEGALKVLGMRAKINEDAFHRQYELVTEIPFDSDRKMMSTLFQDTKKKVHVFTKGSPVKVLEQSSHIWDGASGKLMKMTKKEKEEILSQVKEKASQAYRVLGIAVREISPAKKYSQTSTEKDLIFLGCVAMMDPPRRGVKHAFQVARKAGIKTVVITGDSHLTATAIAERVGLLNEQNRDKVIAMEGKDMAKLSDTELINQIQESEAAIFSRVSPEQKLRIVRGLKRRGEVVAVTGDGVNDAPAIKKADVGVAMGKIGTSVAKDVAQVVLTDDSYSTLVYAIKEGRTIYQNLVKTVKSCYTSNFAELTLVLLGIFLAAKFFDGITPLLPVQILLIDLVGETFPLIALTLDPLRKGGMKLPPRKPKDHVLTTRSISDIIVTGIIMGVAGFLAFAYGYKVAGSAMVATTMTYLMIVLSQYLNILSRRDMGTTFTPYLFKNKALWWSFGITLVFLGIFIYTPFAQHPKIGFTAISWSMWGMMGIVSFALIGVLELKKWLFHLHLRPKA